MQFRQVNYTTTLHPFNGLFSMTTWVIRHQKGKPFWILHQKGKPFWILLEQEMMGWQWNQLDHMQIIYTLLQTDNHASTSPLISTCRMPFPPTNQQCQSTKCTMMACLYCRMVRPKAVKEKNFSNTSAYNISAVSPEKSNVNLFGVSLQPLVT